MTARLPFTTRQRRRMADNYGHRPTNEWGMGDLPAPYAEGDIVDLVDPDAMPSDRMRGNFPGVLVVAYATSVGEGDEWYFRVWDGQNDARSDRLHVFPEGPNYMAGFTLVDTADPEGLALRERMLADGWTYVPPPVCDKCGSRVPRPTGGTT